MPHRDMPSRVLRQMGAPQSRLARAKNQIIPGQSASGIVFYLGAGMGLARVVQHSSKVIAMGNNRRFEPHLDGAAGIQTAIVGKIRRFFHLRGDGRFSPPEKVFLSRLKRLAKKDIQPNGAPLATIFKKGLLLQLRQKPGTLPNRKDATQSVVATAKATAPSRRKRSRPAKTLNLQPAPVSKP